MKRQDRATLWLGLGGLWLSAVTSFGGQPIRFIRPPNAAVVQAQVPVNKLDKDLDKILDSFEAPSPFDGVAAGPVVDRSRGQRGTESRRAQLAREEREKWLWYDSGDLEARDKAEAALGAAAPEMGVAPGEEKIRAAANLRQGSGEKADRSDSHIPMHLLSPQLRQKMQAEAAAERRVRTSEDSLLAETSADTDLDLSLRIPDKVEIGKLLSNEETANQVLRELVGGSRFGPRSGAVSSDLGSLGGSEFLASPSSLGINSELPQPRLGASILDRSYDSERGLGTEPSRWAPTFTPERSGGALSGMSGLGGDVSSRRSTIPESPAYQAPREIPEYDLPRRGGQLGR